MMTNTATFPLWQAINSVEASPVEVRPQTDHALTQRAAQGEMAAFEELYQRHNRRVYSLCLRMTQNVSEAEDLAQEVFIQLFRKVGSFRGESAFTTICTGVSPSSVVCSIFTLRLRKCIKT